jgi:hypothetical protein
MVVLDSTPTDGPLQRVLDALTAHGHPARRGTNGWWNARCPAHDDHNPSLGVRQGDRGAILKCQAGCTTEAIISALGLNMRDLFDDGHNHANHTQPKPGLHNALARYIYEDEHGQPAYMVTRHAGKEFRQWHPTPGGAWRPGRGDHDIVPYRLRALMHAIASGETVLLVEGEKDADTATDAGLVATTIPMGAGKWRDDLAHYFRGGDIVVVADRDQPGYRHALDIVRGLTGNVRQLRIAQAAEGKDLSDHLAHHPVEELELLTIDELVALADGAEPEPDPWRGDLYTADAVLQIPPPDPLLDGYLDRDSLAALYGPPGAGKSFLALDWALHVATNTWWARTEVHGGPVLYIAAEGVAGLGTRVRAWLTARQRISLNDTPITWLARAVNLGHAEQVQRLTELVRDIGAVLVIIDTLARCAAGLEENSAKDTSTVIDAMDRIRTCGTRPTVLAVHHSGKDISNGLRGSSALLGAMDTVLLTRPTDRGLLLEPEKQKNHELGSRTHLWLNPQGPSAVISTRPPTGGQPDLHAEHYDILDALRRIGEPASRSDLAALLEVDPAVIYRRLIDLQEEGLVARNGKGPATRWALTNEGHTA